MRVADIQTLYDYNYWANDRILHTATAITDEQFTAPTRFPHRSLRGTLVHVLGAERIWLNFWQGNARQPFLSEEECSDLATLTERWRQEEAELRAYIATLADEDLDQSRTSPPRVAASEAPPPYGASCSISSIMAPNIAARPHRYLPNSGIRRATSIYVGRSLGIIRHEPAKVRCLTTPRTPPRWLNHSSGEVRRRFEEWNFRTSNPEPRTPNPNCRSPRSAARCRAGSSERWSSTT